VIAVCGKYRTGKSYLLNKLFLNQEDLRGFTVGPSINPCTKGLWLYRHCFYSPSDTEKQMPIIIIDTEGLGAYDTDENHDTKIFLLGLLMSSFLLFNSVGSIDENALTNLSLVINLGKQLQIRQGEQVEDSDLVAKYFPTFFWVLRDFALQLRDAQGNQITQKEYLEMSLKDQKGSSDAIEKKNRIRRYVRNFFQERECFTLVRPVEEESQLQSLSKCTDLRPEFVQQIDSLRARILKKVKAKTLDGKLITGSMLVELAESYTQAMNKGSVPTIDSAWRYVQKSQINQALEQSLVQFTNALKTPLSKEQLKQHQKQALAHFAECTRSFERDKLLEDTQTDLIQKIKQSKREAVARNSLEETK
jgi:hypothetical protein